MIYNQIVTWTAFAILAMFFLLSSSEWLTVIFFLLKTERAFYKPLPLYQHNGCTIPLIVS